MTSWTTPADVVHKLRRRWTSGSVLTAYGEGQPWEPLPIAIRGPTAGEVAADLDRVRSWARSWARRPVGRIEYRRVGGRLVGDNELPAKVWIDSYEQLWSALGTERDVQRFADLVSATRAGAPRLADWMIKHPKRVLELAAEWPAIIDTVQWIDAHADGSQYIRQIDVPGVDTKFIDRHRLVLAALLDHQLDEHRIDHTRPRTDFAGRYGFRRRPGYVRVRSLTPGCTLVAGFGELTFRVDELAARPLPHATVYVIENETTYLAFPPAEDAIAIFGGGYAASVLEGLSWLADRDLVYWGDIDTHGFAILDRVRRSFPEARSMLMDRGTLLAHESHWVTEDAEHVAHLPNLRPVEAELYHDLVEDALGPSVRLEQERVSYSAIRRAIWPQRSSSAAVVGCEHGGTGARSDPAGRAPRQRHRVGGD